MQSCMHTCRQGQGECSGCVQELQAPLGVTHQPSLTTDSTCLPAAKGKESPLEVCKALLEEFRVAPAMYQVGRTKLFFRAGVLGHLEDTWARIQRSAATKLTDCPMSAGRLAQSSVSGACPVLLQHTSAQLPFDCCCLRQCCSMCMSISLLHSVHDLPLQLLQIWGLAAPSSSLPYCAPAVPC